MNGHRIPNLILAGLAAMLLLAVAPERCTVYVPFVSREPTATPTATQTVTPTRRRRPHADANLHSHAHRNLHSDADRYPDAHPDPNANSQLYPVRPGLL